MGYLDPVGLGRDVFHAEVLNPLMRAGGKQGCRRLRERLMQLFAAGNGELQVFVAMT